MISPKEISEKTFERAARGYKVDEVDTFLKEVAFSVAKILKSYDESEAKIHKLVDKVNEYRNDEDAIKTAILGAQKQGRQIIVDAELEAERIIAEARQSAEKMLEETKGAYADELAKLENLKKEVTAFKAQLTELYNRQLHLIMEIPEFNEEENEVNDDMEMEIDLEVTEPISEDIESFEDEPVINTQSILGFDDEPYSNPVRFGDLRFGQNHIK